MTKDKIMSLAGLFCKYQHRLSPSEVQNLNKWKTDSTAKDTSGLPDPVKHWGHLTYQMGGERGQGLFYDGIKVLVSPRNVGEVLIYD